MENKTLNMLEGIINSIKEIITSNGDYKGAKALSHSYETLLKNIKLNDRSEVKTLESHKELLEDIISELEDEVIPKTLKSQLYLELNHLTTTFDRIQKINNSLEYEILNGYKKFNETVLIIGKDDFVKNKYAELTLHCKVLQEYNEGNKLLTFTDYKNLTTVTHKVNLKGRRYNEVYIDPLISQEDYEIIEKYVRVLGSTMVD